jgi:U6 snRNA-associated Sm-like protein LSm5
MAPLSLLDRCVGSPLWVILKGNSEFAGTLLGFDDYANLVLGNVTEFSESEQTPGKMVPVSTRAHMLIHGSQVAMMVPGSSGPSSSS